ncbi:uncharacterized protein SOCEGT47_038130 [Sorangium cellulosum]|uniref:Type VI lipoprotein IgE-like C-terminal domain-containing protein n=1 Tax=Sorangium cellulosum TaxID=56 RepID=A0A4P2Q227_SORCE|nr:hypothetical protein [Sorangium cellulosum]AUX23290.1 uncharacterized protein SOCEGT47_038130 [Sorangium cellulosum]
MTRPARPAFAVLAAAALAALAGCAGSTTRIVVDAPAKTNGGAMLYMMVRHVNEALAAESYQEAAAKLFGEQADGQILSKQPIFPGEEVTVTLDDDGKSDVAVYFFFTAPDGAWRMSLRNPLPEEVVIRLGEHRIERTKLRRR